MAPRVDNIDPDLRYRADPGLKSLGKVMRILDCFSVTDRTLSLAEICARTGHPKSTTHRLLAAMREAGLLDQQRDRYRLGLKLYELGNTVLANMELHREARPFVEALARLSGQGVHLAVFDGRQAIVVHRAEPSPELNSALTLIEAAPVHCTGVGKAILAFQSDPVIDRVIEAGLPRLTDATITDPTSLRAELAAIRARGFSTDEGEHQPGLRCVGAPIRDAAGRVVASISVSGPAWRLPVGEVANLAKIVRHSAACIAAALGFRG
jgi:DNA-binding IclR family transcriptional regulator